MTAAKSDDKDERADRQRELSDLLDDLESIQAAYEMAGGEESKRLDSDRIECRKKICALFARAPLPECGRSSPELADRTEANWLLVGEFFASRNWPDTKLGNAARSLNADVPRILEVLRGAVSTSGRAEDKVLAALWTVLQTEQGTPEFTEALHRARKAYDEVRSASGRREE